MCNKTGKYNSMAHARKTIRFMKGKGYCKLRPYYCKECHCFHVSSEKQAISNNDGNRQ